MTITRNFKLCLNAGTQNAPYINANQYDEGEQWIFDLYTEGGQKFTPSTGAIIGIKSDGHAILNSGTVNSDGQVVITETQQMTAASGLAVFELLIEGETHGTANFIVNVERRPSDDAEFSDSDLSMLQEAIDSAAEIEDLLGGQDVPTVITPIISDWLDENITNPSNPPIDTSLTVAGAAADAKKTGDEITDLKSAIGLFNTGETVPNFVWENGSWNAAGKEASTSRIRPNDYIYASDVERMVMSTEEGYQCALFMWNGNGTYIGYYGNAWQTSLDYETIAGYKYAIAVRKSTNEAISPSESTNFHCTFYKTGLAQLNLSMQENSAEIAEIGNVVDSKYPYPFDYNASLIGSDNTTKFYTPTGGGIKNLVIHNHGIGHNFYVQTFYKTANYRTLVIRGNVGNATSIYLEYAVSGAFSGVETFSMQSASYDISCDCTVDWDVVNAGYGQNLTLQKAALSNAVIDNATMHIIVVDLNGTGDYTTIQGAVDAANDGDMIYIKSGRYEEAVVNTKQIVVKGQDKESTVLFNATGEYATPPLWTCSGRWENLTVYAWNRDNKSFDSLTRLGYAFHLDQKWDSVHSRRHIEIRNCTFKSDFNDCIGCGIDEDGYIEISDTICEATHRSGMKVHPFPVAGGTSKMVLKNNVFKKGADDNAYGLMFHTGGTDNVNFNTVQVEAYNNIAKTYDAWNTNCFFMDDYNYGNTLDTMNRFTL